MKQMVFLAITSEGLRQALLHSAGPTVSVWCGSDAITEREYEAQRTPRLSRFRFPLQGETREVLEGALDTIREHHPGETIWVEGV